MASRDRGGTSRDRGGTAHTIVVDNSKVAPKALVYPQEELRKMLTAYELEVFDTINQARQNPARMVERLEEMKQYYSDDNVLRMPNEPALKTREGVAAVEDAIRDLQAIAAAPLAPMALWKGLIFSCRDHVSDQWRAENSPTGHQGTDNSTPPARGSRYGEWGLLCGEALSYGGEAPAPPLYLSRSPLSLSLHPSLLTLSLLPLLSLFSLLSLLYPLCPLCPLRSLLSSRRPPPAVSGVCCGGSEW